MPGIDGLSVIREAKRLKADLPVIIITGYSTETAAIEAVNLGVSGYLTKPFRVPQVLAAAAKAIGEPILIPIPSQCCSSPPSRNPSANACCSKTSPGRSSAGERVGLCGPNGAGKTTLLKMLAGLRRARRGQHHQAVGADGRLPAAGRPRARRPLDPRRSELRVRRSAGGQGARCTTSRSGSATRRCRRTSTTRCSSATARCRIAFGSKTATASI